MKWVKEEQSITPLNTPNENIEDLMINYNDNLILGFQLSGYLTTRSDILQGQALFRG